MFQSRRLLVPRERDGQEVFHLADAIGAQQVEDLSHPIENGITREVTWMILPELLLQYAEDCRSFSSFAVLTGKSREQVAHFTSRVSEFLQAPTFGDLMSEISVSESAPEDQFAREIIRLGIAVDSAAAVPFVDFLTRHHSDPRLAVRSAVLMSMQYAFLPEFQPLLERVATGDPDPDVRAEARAMWDSSRETHGVHGGGS